MTMPMRRGILESRSGDLNIIQSEALIDENSLLVDAGFDQSFNNPGPFLSTIFGGHMEEGAGSLHGTGGTQNAFQKSPLYSRGYKETCVANFFSSNLMVFSESEHMNSLPGKAWPTVPQIFDQSIRDTLLAIIAREQRSEEIFPGCAEFPSTALMDILADRFLRKQNRKLDCWIHTATFDPRKAPADLTFMILAASALKTQVPYLCQWAYQVCRFIKRRLLMRVRILPLHVHPEPNANYVLSIARGRR